MSIENKETAVKQVCPFFTNIKYHEVECKALNAINAYCSMCFCYGDCPTCPLAKFNGMGDEN